MNSPSPYPVNDKGFTADIVLAIKNIRELGVHSIIYLYYMNHGLTPKIK